LQQLSEPAQTATENDNIVRNIAEVQAFRRRVLAFFDAGIGCQFCLNELCRAEEMVVAVIRCYAESERMSVRPGRIPSKVWRSASRFVPPRYFYRGGRGKVTLKEKDRPERQLVECLKAAGVATGGSVWRQTGKNGAPSRLQSMPPLPLWDVIRAPAENESMLNEAVAVAVHQNGSDKRQRHQRRVGVFFEIEFDAPVPLPVPALGHSCHFGLGLFVAVPKTNDQ